MRRAGREAAENGVPLASRRASTFRRGRGDFLNARNAKHLRVGQVFDLARLRRESVRDLTYDQKSIARDASVHTMAVLTPAPHAHLASPLPRRRLTVRLTRA